MVKSSTFAGLTFTGGTFAGHMWYIPVVPPLEPDFPPPYRRYTVEAYKTPRKAEAVPSLTLSTSK